MAHDFDSHTRVIRFAQPCDSNRIECNSIRRGVRFESYALRFESYSPATRFIQPCYCFAGENRRLPRGADRARRSRQFHHTMMLDLEVNYG